MQQTSIAEASAGVCGSSCYLSVVGRMNTQQLTCKHIYTYKKVRVWMVCVLTHIFCLFLSLSFYLYIWLVLEPLVTVDVWCRFRFRAKKSRISLEPAVVSPLPILATVSVNVPAAEKFQPPGSCTLVSWLVFAWLFCFAGDGQGRSRVNLVLLGEEFGWVLYKALKGE